MANLRARVGNQSAADVPGLCKIVLSPHLLHVT